MHHKKLYQKKYVVSIFAHHKQKSHRYKKKENAQIYIYISYPQQWHVYLSTQCKHEIDYNMCFPICDAEIDGFEGAFILPA